MLSLSGVLIILLLAYLTYNFQNGLQVIAKTESDSSKIEALIDDFLKVFD